MTTLWTPGWKMLLHILKPWNILRNFIKFFLSIHESTFIKTNITEPQWFTFRRGWKILGLLRAANHEALFYGYVKETSHPNWDKKLILINVLNLPSLWKELRGVSKGRMLYCYCSGGKWSPTSDRCFLTLLVTGWYQTLVFHRKWFSSAHFVPALFSEFWLGAKRSSKTNVIPRWFRTRVNLISLMLQQAQVRNSSDIYFGWTG